MHQTRPKPMALLAAMVLLFGSSPAAGSSLRAVLEAAANALGEDHEFKLLRTDPARMRAYRETVSLMLQSLAEDGSSVEAIVRGARFALEDDTAQIEQALLIEARVAGQAKLDVFLAAGDKAAITFALGGQHPSERPLRDVLSAPAGLAAPAPMRPDSSDYLAAQAASVLKTSHAAPTSSPEDEADLDALAALVLSAPAGN